MLFLIGIAAILVVPGVALSLSIGSIFPNIPDALHLNASAAALIMVLALAASMPFTALLGTFLGFQNNKSVTIAIVLAKTVSTALMISSVRLGGGIISLATCHAIGALLPIVYYSICWRRLYLVDRIDIRRAKKNIINEFSRYSMSLIALGVASILLLGLSIPIIGWHDLLSVAPYSVALIYANLLLVPQSAILSVVLPRVSERSTHNDPVMMGVTLLKFTRFASLPLSGITAGLVVIAPLFLKLWIGGEIATKATWPAVFLILSQFLGLTMHPYRIVILGTGQQFRTTPAILMEGIVNIALSLILIGSFGLIGVAIAAIGGSVFGILFHTSVSMRLTDSVAVSRPAFLKVAVLLPAVSILPAMLALYIEQTFATSPPITVGLAGLSSGLALAVTYWTVLTPADVLDLRAALRLRRP
jgi:O-antigen/teichoic acid export membrane protein